MILVLLSTLAFGVTPALVKLSNETIGLFDLITYRALAAAAILAIWWSVQRRRQPLARGGSIGWRGFALGAVMYAPQLLLYFSSFQYLDTSLAVAIGFMYPSFVVIILSLRTRAAPARAEIVTTLVAILGVVAVAAPWGGAARASILGVILVLVSALLFAFYVITANTVLADISPIQLGAHLLAGIATSMAVAGAILGEIHLPSDLKTCVILVLLGILNVVALTTYFGGLTLIGPSRTSILDTAQPAVALLAGIALLDESLTGFQATGIVLILISITATAVRSRQRRAGAPKVLQTPRP